MWQVFEKPSVEGFFMTPNHAKLGKNEVTVEESNQTECFVS